MSTLLLRLAGPMQAWGSSSRFARRRTDRAPTKSGVLGLLAAATGLRRTDPLEELLTLRFGVRIDQPGHIERDFHTARPVVGKPFPLTDRFYLTDAVFLAAVEGDNSLIESLAEAVRRPAFPLYLGRRSCPPSGQLVVDVVDAGLWASLVSAPYQAAGWWQQKQSPQVELEVRVDADAISEARMTSDFAARQTEFRQKDEPLSFDPQLRQYELRSVIQTTIPVVNSRGQRVDRRREMYLEHDPMAAVGGA